jgi:hypothetical protein
VSKIIKASIFQAIKQFVFPHSCGTSSVAAKTSDGFGERRAHNGCGDQKGAEEKASSSTGLGSQQSPAKTERPNNDILGDVNDPLVGETRSKARKNKEKASVNQKPLDGQKDVNEFGQMDYEVDDGPLFTENQGSASARRRRRTRSHWTAKMMSMSSARRTSM